MCMGTVHAHCLEAEFLFVCLLTYLFINERKERGELQISSTQCE